MTALVAACTGGGTGDPGHGGGPPGEGSGEEFAPVPVEVATIEAADLARAVSSSTTLQSAVEVTVVSELTGTLREIHVEEGDRVEGGAVLARILNDDVRISVQEADAAVERARREVERLRPLYDSGYLARQVFEQAEFELETARTNLRRLQTQGASQTVRAPSAGVVISRTVDLGEVVVPNQTLFVVADVDRLEARLAVPERELASLREGQRAELAVEAFGDAVFGGHLVRIDPVVDPRTGTVEVRVELDEPATDAVRLRPGMFAAVRVITDVHEDVPSVPKRAVVREGGAQHLFVLGDTVERPPSEGSAEPGPLDRLQPYAVRRVPVELGYEDRDRVEVIGEVGVGDRVVVVGQGGLDAASVVVIPSESGAANGSDG